MLAELVKIARHTPVSLTSREQAFLMSSPKRATRPRLDRSHLKEACRRSRAVTDKRNQRDDRDHADRSASGT
jgi:hypothetical protein